MKSIYFCAAFVLLVFGNWVQATEFAVLRDTRGQQGVISPDYATVHNNPLYHESGTSGQNPLYQGSVQISDPGMNPVGLPGINSAGTAVFQSVTDPGTATNGIFARPAGGEIITIHGSNFRDASGAPSINDAGTVVFKSLDGNGNDAIFAKTAGGQATTFTVVVTDSTGNSGPARLGRPAINQANDIAFTAGPADGSSSALYVKPAGGNDPIKLTINGSNFRTAQIVGGHVGSVQVLQDSSEQPAMFSLDPATGDYEAGPIKWMAPESLDLNLSMADDGDVAVCDGQSLRVFSNDVVWNGASPPADATILHIGDALDGSTVSALALAPQSWSDNILTFQATLADGTTGLFTATVPEPATIGVILFCAYPFLRRKRR